MANPGPGWFRSIDAKCTKASRASLKRPASNKSVPRCHQPSDRSEEHTSELQSRLHLVCRLLLEKKNTNTEPLGRDIAELVEVAVGGMPLVQPDQDRGFRPGSTVAPFLSRGTALVDR